MNHYYQNIQGWFDYESIFNLAINSCPENSKIVELGCWKGKSSCYLLVEAFNSNKKFDIYFIDTWAGSKPHLDPNDKACYEPGLAEDEDFVYKIFCNNVNDVNYPKTIIRSDTFDAVREFENNSIQFLFIDTEHEYEHVNKELHMWYPKVQSGGLICGHDYFWEPVKKAVDEFFDKLNLTVMNDCGCWIVYKQ
jgi:hypothetical protein